MLTLEKILLKTYCNKLEYLIHVDTSTREDIVKNLLQQTGVLDPVVTLEKILLRTYCNKLEYLIHVDTREDIVKKLLQQTEVLDPC